MFPPRYRSWLACFSALILAGCSTAPPPPPGFGPLPQKLQKEIDAFYGSLDRALLNRDLDRLMQHYTANVENSYRAFYPKFNAHVSVRRNAGEVLWYYQINLTALEADSIQELRTDFAYQPGVTRDDFFLRYKSFPRQGDGQFSAEPFTEVTVQFRRTGATLQIRSVSAENLRAPDPPRDRPPAAGTAGKIARDWRTKAVSVQHP